MSDMEEKLNAILNDSDAMSRIMGLAQQLSGGTVNPPPEPKSPAEPDIDPKLLSKIMPLVQEMSRTQSQSADLLRALRPYLKEERQGKVERAIKLAHLIHVAKSFLAEGGLDLV